MNDAHTPGSLLTLAKEVAIELDDGWYAEPSPWEHTWPVVYLAGPDGLRVRCETGPSWRAAARDRLILTGSFDGMSDHMPRRERRAKITVRADREPVAIAGELTRRLLPVYQEQFAATVERLQRHQTAEEERQRALALVAHTFGGEPWVSRWSHQPDRVGMRTPVFDYHMRAEAHVRQGYVDFDITVPYQHAGQVAEFVAELHRKHDWTAGER